MKNQKYKYICIGIGVLFMIVLEIYNSQLRELLTSVAIAFVILPSFCGAYRLSQLSSAEKQERHGDITFLDFLLLSVVYTVFDLETVRESENAAM